MKFAVIAPVKDLETYGDMSDNIHLVLAHLILGNEKYADFYRRRSEMGDYIILDNSAHEFGVGIGPEELCLAIDKVKASEVVLPDRLFFGEDTVEMTSNAYNIIKSEYPGMNFMITPQGRTHAEWQDCFGHMLLNFKDDDEVTVGISKDYEVWEGGLFRLVGMIPKDIPIHLLGWGRQMWVPPMIEATFPKRVRSIDSAKPLVYAMAGISLRKPISAAQPRYPRRQENFFESMKEIDYEIAVNNIEAIKEGLACGLIIAQPAV